MTYEECNAYYVKRFNIKDLLHITTLVKTNKNKDTWKLIIYLLSDMNEVRLTLSNSNIKYKYIPNKQKIYLTFNDVKIRIQYDI